MTLIPVAESPSWADVLVAFATVGAVAVALGVALWTDRKAAVRLKAEHDRSDELLAGERKHSAAQIEEERRVTREREQLAEAYAVQVVPAEIPLRFINDEGTGKQLVAIVVNRSAFTITRIEAQFCLDGRSLVSHFAYRRVSGFEELPVELRSATKDSAEHAMRGILTPWDLGIRYGTDTINDTSLKSPYPVVRWTDHLGARWEHKRGEVHQVRDDEPWTP